MVISLVINGDTKISIWIWHNLVHGIVSGVVVGKWEYLWAISKKYKKIFRVEKGDK